MKYAVALNTSQAKLLISKKIIADAVLSFCPATTHMLESNGYRVIPALTHYKACSHAKATALIVGDIEALRPQLQRFYQLSNGETENMGVYLYHFLCIAYYLYFATRAYNRPENLFLWCMTDGKIKEGSYTDMYLDITEQGKVKITSYSNTGFSYAHYLLTNMCNAVLASVIKLRGKKTVLDFGDRLPTKILGAMIDASDDYLIIASHKVSKNMYKSLRFFFKSLKRALSKPAKNKPIWIFRTANPYGYKATTATPDITLAHKPVTLATQAAIQSYVPFLKTEYAIGRATIEKFKPAIAVSDFAKYPYILAAQEKMRDYGGLVVMMNHGTHTAQQAPISKLAGNTWAAQDRVITDFVTDHVPKSPLTYAVTQEITARRDFRLHKLNLFQTIKKHPAPSDEFMIMHAGNFMDMYYHIPWCKDTSEEYLLSIFELLEEMQNIEGVRLVIKLKPQKAGAHNALIEAKIQELSLGHKVVIDTHSKFSDLLEKTSLIISNLSGTVEEALINHIPVMIHTYHKRYFHIPPHVLPESGLAPAYLVKNRSDIKSIIAFAKANRESLFNPKLYANVAWKTDEQMTLTDFAKRMMEAMPV